MRFKIVLICFLVALQVLSAAKLKQNFRFPSKPAKTQSIYMNNMADSNSNAVAINAGLFGDANAYSVSNAGNYNMISQSV